MKKTIATITIIIGIIVMIMGLSMGTQSTYSHSGSAYNIFSASFGADFYTYVYDGLDTIVDELDEINDGISVLAKNTRSICDAVTRAGKMIVIAIGLLIVTSGLKQLAYASEEAPVPVAFSPATVKTSDFEPIPVGGWKCTCGKVHSDYVSSCSCGKNKRDILNA